MMPSTQTIRISGHTVQGSIMMSMSRAAPQAGRRRLKEAVAGEGSILPDSSNRLTGSISVGMALSAPV